MNDFTARRDARPKEKPKPSRMCSVDGCGKDTGIAIAVAWKGQSRWQGVYSDMPTGYEFSGFITRCPECYDRERHQQPMDHRVAAEANRPGLTPGRKGESLSQYMARHGIEKDSLRLYERVPGSDDDA